eukprot:TRINITY_DN10772_c0_g1_i1.p1 TRINITY_DN10772_c0_g1~~TRINITY_DN10772_c0_g1_i1.p1  ORF type:complete len:661 (+),score=23.27 TRINITY_DN10772_c0_g1_i1:73-2055(+)
MDDLGSTLDFPPTRCLVLQPHSTGIDEIIYPSQALLKQEFQGRLVKLQDICLVQFRDGNFYDCDVFSFALISPPSQPLPEYSVVGPSTSILVLPRQLVSIYSIFNILPSPDNMASYHYPDQTDQLLQCAIRLRCLPPPSSSASASLSSSSYSSLLVSGPSGCGKSSLVVEIAATLGVNLVRVTLHDVLSKYPSEPDRRLEELFHLSVKLEPCILLLEDVETIFPSDMSSGLSSNSSFSWSLMTRFLRVFSSLFSVDDDSNSSQSFLSSSPRLIVIGTSSRPSAIHRLVIRQFQREISLSAPNAQQIEQIFRFHTRLINLSSDVDFGKLADSCQGYVAADIVSVCQNAFLRAQHENKASSDEAQVSHSHFEDAILHHEPIGIGRQLDLLRPVDAQPNGGASFSWSQLPGLDGVKARLEEVVVWPLTRPQQCAHMGIDGINGVLIHGRPGVGKTMLVHALPSVCGAHFISVSVADLVKSEVGESEKAVADLFRRARATTPCILFFDEVQSIFAARNDAGHHHQKLVSQFLHELDNLSVTRSTLSPHLGVVVIAATNRPESLDPALLRAGRFDEVIHVPPPEFEQRVQILESYRERMQWSENVDVESLGELTMGFTGADLYNLAQTAALRALRRNNMLPLPVEMQDFVESVPDCHPKLNEHLM